MPVVAGHLYRLTFGGALFDKEQWTCTLHYVTGSTPATIDEPALVAGLVLMSHQTQIGAKLEYWKYNEINPLTGRYLSATSNTHEVTLSAGLGMQAPPQNAVVVSLGTAVNRGPAHAGRIFLPLSPAVDQVTGLVSDADRNNIAGGVRTALQGLAAAAQHQTVIWSAKSKVYQPVTKMGVGRVVDTQRRRRKSLPESTAYGAIFS